MSPDDFYVAKILEDEGWTYEHLGDSGSMWFSRLMAGVLYKMEVSADL
jgi:hypothetical protein